jgi:predicted Zn-dependent protease
MVAIVESDTVRARAAANELEQAVTELNVGLLRPLVASLDAEVLHLEGEYETSIARCDSARALQADLRRALLIRARSERALGRSELAVQTLTEYLLQDPASPAGNLELARALVDLGHTSRALAPLEVVVDAWSRADTPSEDLDEARTLLEAARTQP